MGYECRPSITAMIDIRAGRSFLSRHQSWLRDKLIISYQTPSTQKQEKQIDLTLFQNCNCNLLDEPVGTE